jgi:aminoglycoside phosphotransferase (APT) family kinase protein
VTHDDETDIDAPLVRRLLAAQFPQWAGLPVARIDSAGTSNTMYRLGRDMVARFPRRAGAAEDIEKEHRWLPRLGPSLPVGVPVPLGRGTPAQGYPWQWSVQGWLEGENPAVGQISDPIRLAEDLAEFVLALRAIDTAGGPPSYRSERLVARDSATRAALAELEGVVDTRAATAAWEAAMSAPDRSGPQVWIHADLQPGNVLMADGRLTAVIDFGCLGLGDPAVDLIAAWYLLPADARDVFRAASEADDATWARGRGWALSIALVELRYLRRTNPVMSAIARHVVDEVLTDDQRVV